MQKSEQKTKIATSYKVVICDLDGTLLDSLEDLADAANVALNAFGFPEHPVASYRQFVGNGVRVLLQRALPEEARAEETISRCLDIFTREYRRNWNCKSKPYPGIPELLDWLQEQGLSLAVLSNKPQTFIQEIMDYYFSDWKFEPVYGASEAFPRKPDPAGVSLISKQLAVEPGEVVFLGDSNVDMNTANNAGVTAVGVLWGFRGAEELAGAGADLLLEDPLGLASWLRTPQDKQPSVKPQRYDKNGSVAAG